MLSKKLAMKVTAAVISMTLAAGGAFSVMAAEDAAPDTDTQEIQQIESAEASLEEILPEDVKDDETISEALRDLLSMLNEVPEEEEEEEKEPVIINEDLQVTLPAGWAEVASTPTYMIAASTDIRQMLFVSCEQAENEPEELLPDAMAEKAAEALKTDSEEEPEILEGITLDGLYTAAVKAGNSYCFMASSDNTVYMLIYTYETEPGDIEQILSSVKTESSEGETDLSAVFASEE